MHKSSRRPVFKDEAAALLKGIERDPFQNPPRYEQAAGDLAGAYSRRISVQHRLVYQVLETECVVKCCACGLTTSKRRTQIGSARVGRDRHSR